MTENNDSYKTLLEIQQEVEVRFKKIYKSIDELKHYICHIIPEGSYYADFGTECSFPDVKNDLLPMLKCFDGTYHPYQIRWHPYDPLMLRNLRNAEGWVWAIVEFEGQRQYMAAKYIGRLERWVMITEDGRRLFLDAPIEIARIISSKNDNE